MIKAELGPTAVPGSTLTNRTSVLDDQGNSVQATLHRRRARGRPRRATASCSSSYTAPKTVTIAGGRPGTLKSTLTVTNGARGDAQNVVVTLDGPDRRGLRVGDSGPDVAADDRQRQHAS